MNQDHAAFPDRVGVGCHRKQLNRERGTQMQVKALVGSGDKIGLFTLPFVLLGVLLNILYPAFFRVGGPSLLVRVLALLLLIAGVIIWIWSVFLILTDVPQKRLITKGPYALVKHPLYTGVALLVLPGLGLLLNTWVDILIGFTLYIGSRRFSPEEENLLAKTFVSTWEEYRQQVKIPWL